ncbi:MAG: hypothetical protein AAFY01_01720 [Pseudomonadota bacterium]
MSKLVLGQSSYALAPGGAGSQTIVTDVGNANGIILRTIGWYTNNALLLFRIGATELFLGQSGPHTFNWAGELHLPAGQALHWYAGGSGLRLHCTYDLK